MQFSFLMDQADTITLRNVVKQDAQSHSITTVIAAAGGKELVLSLGFY